MTSNPFSQIGSTGRPVRWLILGASGQLGREWCRRLEKDQVDYRCFTRQDLDITSKVQLEQALEALRPDYIVNCAAFTKVDQAERESDLANAVNAEAVRVLAGLCEEKKIRLIHYSTDYVFPGLIEHRAQFPDGYPESFHPDPINTYGRTKWVGEQGVHEAGGSHLIIRVSWLCGREGGNFIHTMLRLADQNKQLRVVDDQFGCPTFTDSVVTNSLVLAAEGAEGTWHLSSGGETSWYEFARAIFNLSGRNVTVAPIPTSEYPTEARRPAWSRLDIKKLSDVSGSRILPWQQDLEVFLKSLR